MRMVGDMRADRAGAEVVIWGSTEQLAGTGAQLVGLDQPSVNEGARKGLFERVHDRFGAGLDQALCRCLPFGRLGVIIERFRRLLRRLQLFEEVAPIIEAVAGEVLWNLPASLPAELVHPTQQQRI